MYHEFYLTVQRGHAVSFGCCRTVRAGLALPFGEDGDITEGRVRRGMRRQFYLGAVGLALTLLPACAAVSKRASYERSRREDSAIVASLESSDEESEPASFGSSAAAPMPASPPPPPPPGNLMASPAAPPPPSGGPGDATKASAGEVATARSPLLIYTADITIAVFEVNASLGQVDALAREIGGFLARRTDTEITIRIPANRFDEAVKRIEKIGDMLHRNVVAEDVTEEFRDLDIRLRSARAVQERLTQLLAKAVKVEDSVLIERELDRVTGEIERIEGRLKFLKDRAAYSTITVTFQARPTETLGQGPFRVPGQWLQNLGLGRLLRL